MVGNASVGTGDIAHEWAWILADLIDQEADDGRPLTITVDKPLTKHGQRLADSLHVRVKIEGRDPQAGRPELEPVSAPEVAASVQAPSRPLEFDHAGGPDVVLGRRDGRTATYLMFNT